VLCLVDEGRSGFARSLRYPDFRRLTIALGISALGSWAYYVALTVFVYHATHSPTWVAIATVGRFVPSLVLGTHGGVLAERFERVRLMTTMDAACGCIMLTLTVVAASSGPVELVIGLAAANSLLNRTIYQPAASLLLPLTAPTSELVAANALRSSVEGSAVAVGSAAGALLLAFASPWLVFAGNAATYLVSAAIVSRIAVRSKPADVASIGHANPLEHVRSGLDAIRASAPVAALVACSLGTKVVYGMDSVQFVVLSESRLGSGAAGYGYLVAGIGVGGLIAAAVVQRISARAHLGGAVLVTVALYCLPTLAFLVLRNPVAGFAVEIVRGGGGLVLDVLTVTALQRALPAYRLGRVFGVYVTMSLLAVSIGALIMPPLLSGLGLDATLVLAGATLPAACALAWPWLRRMDRAAAAHLAEITPRVHTLRTAAIFADASSALLERLATSATELRVEPGEVIVAEGDPTDAFYVVDHGTMAVSASRSDDRIPSLRAGDYFGEIGLINGVARTATVTASERSAVLRIDGAEFLDALASAAASTDLLGVVHQRLARTSSERIETHAG
jgi:predicted MFS family arabinose efflux permease